MIMKSKFKFLVGFQSAKGNFEIMYILWNRVSLTN